MDLRETQSIQPAHRAQQAKFPPPPSAAQREIDSGIEQSATIKPVALENPGNDQTENRIYGCGRQSYAETRLKRGHDARLAREVQKLFKANTGGMQHEDCERQ